MTVWIYIDTNKKEGDVDRLKVFATADAANEWFKVNDPEGVAFEYEVTKRPAKKHRPKKQLQRRGRDGAARDVSASLARHSNLKSTGLNRSADDRSKVRKILIPNGALTTIFWRKLRAHAECPYTGAPIAIIPTGRRSGWKALTAPYVVRRYPLCAKRVAEVQAELQKIYTLARD
jgi:ribosomal protein L34E